MTTEKDASKVQGVDAKKEFGIFCEYYRFKPSLKDDMEGASIIVSHGGAGSIMEALRLKKPLVVVVNEDLMDNHQTELAEAIEDAGSLRCSYCHNLVQVCGIIYQKHSYRLFAVRISQSYCCS